MNSTTTTPAVPSPPPPVEIVDNNNLEKHPINQNLYGNVAKADCDIQTDKRQGLCAITIVIVFIFATFLVYVNTRRKRKEQNRYNDKLVLHPKPQIRPPKSLTTGQMKIGIN